MTTTENTPTDTTSAPVMGFKNPANWVIGPAAGSIGAGLLVGWMRFIPTWAVYTIVALVSIWLVFQAIDWWKNRPSSVGEEEAEEVREPADVA